MRGQLTLIAAPPGVGKSALTATIALKSKVPCLYFSADSDAFTQVSRAISILTDWKLEESAKRVLAGDLDGITERLDEIPIRMIYEASPDLDDIERVIKAYYELYGDFPELIIVDNVTDVIIESDAEGNASTGLNALMKYLHGMARDTGACVIGLHHVTGEYNDAVKPIPLRGLKDQIGRVPEMVLTLWKKVSEFGGTRLMVSTVKNRGGKADISGQEAVELEFIGDSMTIRDVPGALMT